MSLRGTPVARDAKIAAVSTSDRPLLKNGMTRVVSQTWQNCHEDNTSVHATRSLRDGNLAVVLKKANNHVRTK